MAAGEGGVGREQMTAYDRAAWEGCLTVLHAPTRHKLLPAAVRNRAAGLTSWAAGRLEEAPAADAAREHAERAFKGALALTFQPPLRLTQRKLAQAVPVVGVGLNAAMSAELADQTFKRAQAVYRLRFLSEKYGVDPREWVAGAVEIAPGGPPDEVVVDVVEVLEQERTLSDHDGLDDQTGSEAGR